MPSSVEFSAGETLDLSMTALFLQEAKINWGPKMLSLLAGCQEL
jgi:hypothetical protein